MEAFLHNPAREISDEQLDCVSGGGGTNVHALPAVALMNATNDPDNDLQEVMNEVQAQTYAKIALRNQMEAKTGR
jgi:hypothetical protein